MSETISPHDALAEHCNACDGTGELVVEGGGYGAILQKCPVCVGKGRRVRTTHEPASGIGQDLDEAAEGARRARDAAIEAAEQLKGQLAECATDLGAARKRIDDQQKLIRELQGQRAGLERRHEEQERMFLMYRKAWIRELGGKIFIKSHEIDGLVLSTKALRDFALAAWGHILRHQIPPKELAEQARHAGVVE